MKRSRSITLFLFLLLSANALFSQILEPVNWEFAYNKTGAMQYELIFTAKIDKTWHLYSQDIPDGGPIPTSFSINESDNFELVGNVEEMSEVEEKYDPSFDMVLKLFSDKAIFIQKVKIISDEPVTISGSVEYMSCDDQRCLPPKDEEFEFVLEPKDASGAKTAVNSADPQSSGNRSSLLGFFFLSILAGFAGILTPCVFPMIPMTVAFFSRGDISRSKSLAQAIIFGLSIIIIYTSIGLIVSLTSAGADFTSNLSTHWIPNLIFFLLFMTFAASFFGMFELILPNKLINRADNQADKGGLIAAFFMGLTTVLVSFSCTGPIVGALLVEAAGGEVFEPVLGMLGFSLAFLISFDVGELPINDT